MEELDEAKERRELDRAVVIFLIMIKIQESRLGFSQDLKEYVKKMDDDTFDFLMRMFKRTNSLLDAIHIVQRQDPAYDDALCLICHEIRKSEI